MNDQARVAAQRLIYTVKIEMFLRVIGAAVTQENVALTADLMRDVLLDWEGKRRRGC